MILQQHYLACLSQASYLIADERTKTAAIVDPRRDIGVYLEAAQQLGVTIRHVLLTHFHADFVAGHLELRERVGAQIYLGARAKASYEFVPLADGDNLEFGDVQLRILETPGHTPEGISILVFDLKKSATAPHAVLTGDTLFIGDVGRPDLMASVGVTADELAAMLYHSTREKLMRLPAGTLLYPGHGAGSLCGKSLSNETASTIGQQLEHNYALQPMTQAEFTAIVTANQPPAPAYLGFDAELNRTERPTLEDSMRSSIVGISVDDLLRQRKSGAQILDVREPADFAKRHLSGSLNIGLSGKFASWCGVLLDPMRPIVIVAPPGKEPEAILRLGRIGFDRVTGTLSGGIDALAARPELVSTTERISPAELADAQSRGELRTVVDVRAVSEYEAGAIEGSINVPLGELEARLDELPPRGTRMAIHCKSGYRSSAAASLLEREGFEDVVDLVGGFDAWVAAALPVAVQAQNGHPSCGGVAS